MATMIKSYEKIDGNGEYGFFFTPYDSRKSFFVEGFENGVVKVSAICGDELTSFGHTISGCFEAGSNFEEKLMEAFDCDTKVIAIIFDFLGVSAYVKRDEADKVLKEWYLTRERMEGDRIIASRYDILKNLIMLDRNTELEFKNDQAKKEWQEHIEASYHSGSYEYYAEARIYGKYLQYLMKKERKTLSEVVDEANHLYADYSGNQLEFIRKILIQFWRYGELLRNS